MSDLYTPTRRDLIRNAGRGAAVLAVAGVTVATAATPAEAVVTGWRLCPRCYGLWFRNSPNSHCPVFHLFEHFHYDSGSRAYTVRLASEGGNGEEGWHWCYYCGIMFGFRFLGGVTFSSGVCPKWGPNYGHQRGDAGGDSYRLETLDNNNGSVGGGKSWNWRWCIKCNGLFFAGSGLAVTHCPAGGNHNFDTGSPNYMLRY